MQWKWLKYRFFKIVEHFERPAEPSASVHQTFAQNGSRKTRPQTGSHETCEVLSGFGTIISRLTANAQWPHTAQISGDCLSFLCVITKRGCYPQVTIAEFIACTRSSHWNEIISCWGNAITLEHCIEWYCLAQAVNSTILGLPSFWWTALSFASFVIVSCI